jgi:hypothetical protein
MLKTVSSTINAIGALNYKGTWNANTNTPTLTSGVGVKGDYYVVSVAGTTNLDGTDFWGVGDWAVFNGAVWQRVEGGSETETDKIVFNTLANLTATNGQMTWNNDDQHKTVEVGINGDDFYIFQDQIFRVRADANITKGQVVMFTGTLGASGGLKGAPATGLQPEQANFILGVSKDTFGFGDWGNIQYFGEVKGFNTTGGAENWQQGDVLYYNPLVTGGLTKIKPTAPAAIAVVAAVVYVSANNGILFVRPTFGSVLGGTDGNVNFTSLANNDVIVYNTTTNVWVNKQSVTLANVTAANVTVTANLFANLATANTAAMPDPSLPLNPEGYVEIVVNGSTKKIPYYGV